MDKWFNNNNFAKILALAVSVLLWAMVHSNDVTTTPTTNTSIEPRAIDNVKIEPYGIDTSKYVLTSMSKTEVEMQVRGQRSVLTSVFTDEYKVRLDLSNVSPGTTTLPLSHVVPKGVEFVSMEPSSITVTIEELSTKDYDVDIITTGTPAEGHAAGTPVVTPNGPVKVTLPDSQLAAVGKVQGTVNVDGATDNVSEKRVELVAYDLDGNEIQGAVIEPATVSVDIPISEQFTKVPFKVQYKGQLPEGLTLAKVEANVNEVTLFGNQEAIAGIESYSGVTLDLSTLKEAGTETVKVDLTPPPGFEKIEPSSVELSVTVVSSEESTISEKVIRNVPVTLQEPGGSFTASITRPQSGKKDITISGPSDMLDNVDVSDINLVADAKNLKEGSHEVSLKVEAPDYVTVKNSADDLKVTIQIKDNSEETIVPPTQPETKPDEGDGNEPPEEGTEEDPDSGSNEGNNGENTENESDVNDSPTGTNVTP
ncbi:CdaR family protein [Paenibacillus sp. Marseille-Q4541]|uniref:CdaR family protein n=1 Tax=Paenibacillus sp. Marseille-Q4541 TaxID=2831522 RepID=UPI001BACB8B3|nr:CdaR family protein [Paenibacillus sp. Marseille-Q4541]